MCVLSHLKLLPAAPALVPHLDAHQLRRAPRRAVSPRMSEDLEAAVSRLRRSYYGTDLAVDDNSSAVYNQQSLLHTRRSELLGLYSGLPVLYSSSPLLPQSQTVLDVWQRPEAFSTALESYISMFESLLRTPQPWYFAQALAMGDGRARATGTLMRVVNTKRTSDGRLQVLVQGLGRLRILEEVRSEPFPRVDAQLMVDAEALLHAETLVAPRTARGGDGDQQRAEHDRLCLATALARERAWWACDAGGFEDAESGAMPGALVPFSATVGVTATRRRAEREALRSLHEARDAWDEGGATAAAGDAEYGWEGVNDWFMELEAADTAEAAAEHARCARVATLARRPEALDAALSELREIGWRSRSAELEIASWAELDALLARYAAINAAALAAHPEAVRETPRVCAELLALLPDNPRAAHGAVPAAAATRWPDGFRLLELKELIAEEGAPLGVAAAGDGAEGEAGEVGEVGEVGAEGKEGEDGEYPAWRRGARLSFVLADVVSQVYGDGACGVAEWIGAESRRVMAPPVAEVLQEMLEAPSTTVRLRLALRRMQEARRALSEPLSQFE